MAEADSTKDQLHAGAKRVEEEIRDRGAAAGESARDTARGYAQRARDEAYSRGEAYRDYAAGETSKIAAALRRASEDLAEGSPQERLAGRLADEVAETADRMSGMTLEDIYGETSHFARRHPGAFLAGAALVGFATARFLKASGDTGGDDEASAPAPAPAPEDHAGAARPMPNPSAPPGSSAPAPAPAGAPGPTATPSDKNPL